MSQSAEFQLPPSAGMAIPPARLVRPGVPTIPEQLRSLGFPEGGVYRFAGGTVTRIAEDWESYLRDHPEEAARRAAFQRRVKRSEPTTPAESAIAPTSFAQDDGPAGTPGDDSPTAPAAPAAPVAPAAPPVHHASDSRIEALKTERLQLERRIAVVQQKLAQKRDLEWRGQHGDRIARIALGTKFGSAPRISADQIKLKQ